MLAQLNVLIHAGFTLIDHESNTRVSLESVVSRGRHIDWTKSEVWHLWGSKFNDPLPNGGSDSSD
jgi:hypothetical protein